MSAQLHLVSDAPATYADLEAAPAGYTVELIGGRLHAQPRPRLRHARAAIGLGALLAPPFDWGEGGPGGWMILEEPELHFIRDREVLVPDLGGWKTGRLAAMDPDAHRFEVVPDWVCEILCPIHRTLRSRRQAAHLSAARRAVDLAHGPDLAARGSDRRDQSGI